MSIPVRLRLTWGTHVVTRLVCRFLMGVLLVAVVPQVWGSGPRYVTGPPFFTGRQGVPVGWRQTNLMYFTDPGSLSAAVSHQAADALVAAAANVWNLPVANITVGQGGQLAEHVSGQNTFMGANGMVFPADVMSTNAGAIPIAVIYDSDGSVTETLLGAGASDPSECRQDGVTESVDAFDPAGYILHAVIVLNGRCTGAAPQLQLQMQYQLERAFGRVLGLAWSQTNDNVFTGSPTPTYAQELNWPIMHPIDIICGSYTYQCLPNPFQLRPDDVASMVAVYPVTQAGQGKQVSLNNAAALAGVISFPTGEGMAGVNVLIRRQTLSGVTDGWVESSAVTGTLFRRAGTAPFVSAGTDALSSMGNMDQGMSGYYVGAYVPTESNEPAVNLLVSLEAVNPLYMGAHSLGPYAPGNVAVSGTQLVLPPLFFAGTGGFSGVNATIGDAAAACGNGADGTASLPMEAPATGWWNGLLCGYGHASYIAADVKPGRTFTVEVTALDAQGYATTTKAMPVIGVFAPGDWMTPSVALAATAFQAWGVGTTTVSASTGQMSAVRIGIADQRGEGRPDFNYQARMFYADSVTPARIATAGASVTISGMGFRAGNAVSINGIAVSVVSWTASTVVVTAPKMSAVGANDKTAVDVEVWDRTTGATSTMTAALTYDSTAGLPNAMRVVSIPTAAVIVGSEAPVPFTVQVVAADGVTPVVGDTVVFGAVGAQFGSCGTSGSSNCSVVTNGQGMASKSVTPMVAGAVTVQATDGSLQQGGSFVAQAQAGAIIIQSAPTGSVNVGVVAQNPFAVYVQSASGAAMSNVAVTLSVPVGGAIFSGCNTPVCTMMTDGGGNVGVWVTPKSVGVVTIQAAVGNVAQAASFTGASNVDVMQVTAAPSATTWPYTSPGHFAIALLHPDGTPDYAQPVTFTAPAGMIFEGCGSNVCVLTTNYLGAVNVQVPWSATVGTYTIRAAFGAVVQAATFTVQNHSYQLNLVSKPTDNAMPYVSAAVPFAVQVMEDGTTPVAGALVQVTGLQDAVSYDTCGDHTCSLTTDANGIASTTVTPLTSGSISLNAVYSSLTVTANFTTQGGADSLVVVEQPGPGGLLVGATQVLLTKLIGVDGVTPLENKLLFYSVVSGPFAFTNCTATTCKVGTCCGGLGSISGAAYGTGTVTVQVAYDDITTLIQFAAVALPDVLKLVSGPVSGGYAGQAEGVPFAVQAFFNDGVTPVSGRLVTVSVTNGLAGLIACGGAASCVLTADANGMVSTVVTPGSVGSITVTATDGGVSVSSSFTTIAKPDGMTVIASPAANTYVGVAATFAVRVMQGDGVTPRVGASVVFSGTAGMVQFGACGGTSCTGTTGADGSVSVTVTPLVAGLITLQAVDGALAQAVSFSAVVRPDVLSVASAPGNGAWVGLVAASVFSVRLMQGDGVTPDAGKTVMLSAVGATLGCGVSCALVTDGSGAVSTSVMPTVAGVVMLTAVGSGLTATVTFSAAVRPDVMSVVSAPGNGALVGDVAASPVVVQVVAGDGVTPVVGRSVTISVTNGAARLMACGAASCTLSTDANGDVSTGVIPLAAGVVGLTMSESSGGATAQVVTFTAKAKPDLVAMVITPGASVLAGVTAGAPLAVKVTLADGVTPVVGIAVTFSMASSNGGTVRFGACGASVCVVGTGVDGVASSAVIGGLAGDVTLSAAANLPSGMVAVAAPITVLPNQYALTAQNGTLYIAEGATVPVTLSAVAAENGSAAMGQAVHWSAGSGLVLAAANTLTDGAGSTTEQGVLGPMAGGVQISAMACAWVDVCAQFNAVGVAAGSLLPVFASGGQQSVNGGAGFGPVTVQVVDGSGHAVVGAAVSVYQTVRALDVACPAQGRCPAAAVLGSDVAVMNSAGDGTVAFTPMTMSGAATSTEIAISVGTQGFQTTVLTNHP